MDAPARVQLSAQALRTKWKEDKLQRQIDAEKIVTVHGTNVGVLMSEMVGLIEYYRLHRSKTVWEKEWKIQNSTTGETFLNKLLVSMQRNAEQLPLENPQQFALDVAEYIQKCWGPPVVPLVKRKRSYNRR